MSIEHFTEELLNEKSKTERILKTSTSRISKLPSGKIKVINHHGSQFYVYNETCKKWKYESKKNINFVKDLAQYDYEKRIQKKAKAQLRVINSFLTKHDSQYIERIQDSLSKNRLNLIKPYVEPKEQYISNWLTEHYTSNPFPKNNGFITIHGDIVRSKSEAMIADRLYAMNIPYRYECACELTDGVVFPDFTLLDINTRSEIILEHFGLMDNADYVNQSFIHKMVRYINNGYIPGKNLIFTFESSTQAINMATLDKLLRDIGLIDSL